MAVRAMREPRRVHLPCALVPFGETVKRDGVGGYERQRKQRGRSSVSRRDGPQVQVVDEKRDRK